MALLRRLHTLSHLKSITKCNNVLINNYYRHFSVSQQQNTEKSRTKPSTEELWNKISHFYYKYGDVMYTDLSQLDHALQSGTLAYKDTKDPIVTIGAFLHDLGHLVGYERKGKDPRIDNWKHEQIGYDYLLNELGITDERILNSILYHVEAKRYLCYIDETYYDHLSKSSQHSLQLQGGILTKDEAKQFEQIPFYKDACQVRKWDDNAKKLDAVDVLDMNQMKEIFFQAFDE